MISIPVGRELELRQYVKEDANALFDLINRSRAHLAPWLSWVNHTTKLEHSVQFIDDSYYQAEVQEGIALGIFQGNLLIGGIGLHQWNHKLNSAQVGYWIGQPYEGKGVMLKCLIAFTGFLFQQVGLNKVELHYAALNVRSGKLAERAGFKMEGIIRAGHLRNGIIEDLVVMGMLRGEWATSSLQAG